MIPRRRSRNAAVPAAVSPCLRPATVAEKEAGGTPCGTAGWKPALRLSGRMRAAPWISDCFVAEASFDRIAQGVVAAAVQFACVIPHSPKPLPPARNEAHLPCLPARNLPLPMTARPSRSSIILRLPGRVCHPQAVRRDCGCSRRKRSNLPTIPTARRCCGSRIASAGTGNSLSRPAAPSCAPPETRNTP